jgi:hypothetical protein
MSSSASVVLRRVVPVLAALAVILGAFTVAPAQAATAKITGVVKDADGKVRGNAEVELQLKDPDGIGTVDAVTTKADGAFSFTVENRGRSYRIKVRDSGGFGEAYSALFEVTRNKVVPALVTYPSASISGRVADVETDAAVNAHIVAHRVTGAVVDSDGLDVFVSDRDSGFVLSGLAPGTYRFAFEPMGGGYAPTFSGNNAVRLSDATNVTIEAGVDHPLGTIGVSKGASFTGRVVNHLGKPFPEGVAGVGVYDVDADYSIDRLQTPEINPDGTWTLDSLPTGSYKISIQGDDFTYLNQFHDGAATLAESEPLTLGAGEQKELAATVLKLSSGITGTVRNGSKALQGIKVDAYPVVEGTVLKTSVNAVLTKKDGTFIEKPLRAGTYKLVLTDPNGVYATMTSAAFSVGAAESKAAGVVPMLLPTKKLTVSASGSKAKATFKVTVTASKVTPTGYVTVKLGGVSLKKAKLKKGKVTIAVTKQVKGKRAYTITYAGDSSVLGKTISKTVTVK